MPVNVVCGVCRDAIGAVAPLDSDRTLAGLCAGCFERGQLSGLDALTRVSLSRLDHVIHRADARQLGLLALQLERRRQAVLARLGPHALAAAGLAPR
jgi:hypothetical protein